MKIRNLAAAALIATSAITTGFSATASMNYARTHRGGSSLYQAAPEAMICRIVRLARAGAAGYDLAGISGVAAGVRHPELFVPQPPLTD